jgi:DNA-binding NtrC family response regulator
MAAALPRRRILVADDEPSVRELLRQYLAVQHAAYDVETVASGEEAVRAVRERRPALVLLDIEMPGMGGVDALRAIRAFDTRIPVVMVTGNESARIAGEVIALGALSYVPKPVRFDYLDHLVATALSR